MKEVKRVRRWSDERNIETNEQSEKRRKIESRIKAELKKNKK